MSDLSDQERALVDYQAKFKAVLDECGYAEEPWNWTYDQLANAFFVLGWLPPATTTETDAELAAAITAEISDGFGPGMTTRSIVRLTIDSIRRRSASTGDNQEEKDHV